MVPFSLASEKLEGDDNFENFEIDVLVESNFTLLGLFRLINCWSKDYITLKFIVQIKIVRISLNYRFGELSYVFTVLPPLFRHLILVQYTHCFWESLCHDLANLRNYISFMSFANI